MRMARAAMIDITAGSSVSSRPRSCCASPISTVPSSVWRSVSSGNGRNGRTRSSTSTCPLLGAAGRREPDHRRQPRVAQPRREDDALARDGAARRVQREAACVRLDSLHAVIGEQRAAGSRDACVERAQEPQRIAVAVQRAVRGAGDVGADAREARRDRRAVEHVDARVVACLRGPLRHPPRARVEFLRRQAHVQAARLAQRDVDAGLLAQQRGKTRPFARRALRPRGVAAACRAPCPAPR